MENTVDLLTLAIRQLVTDGYIAYDEEGDILFLDKGKKWVDKIRRTSKSKATYMDTAIRYLVRKKFVVRVPTEEGEAIRLTDKGKIKASDLILKGKNNVQTNAR